MKKRRSLQKQEGKSTDKEQAGPGRRTIHPEPLWPRPLSCTASSPSRRSPPPCQPGCEAPSPPWDHPSHLAFQQGSQMLLELAEIRFRRLVAGGFGIEAGAAIFINQPDRLLAIAEGDGAADDRT